MKKLLKWFAILLSLCVLLLVCAIVIAIKWPLQALPIPTQNKAIVLTNAIVVDLDTGKLQPGTTLVLQENKIVAMGTTLVASSYPKGAKKIDAKGKYVIPGLWDMHVHSLRLFPQLQAPLYIANGVTRIRDMKGCHIDKDPLRACHPDKRAWNKRVAKGTLIAPTFMGSASFSVNGPMKTYAKQNPIYNCSNEKEARQLVRHFKKQGLDFIKVFSRIPRKAYFALMDEAKKQKLPVVGHLPYEISSQEASDAGQKSIEHAFAFLWDCYPGIDAYRKKKMKGIFKTKALRSMIDRSDPKRCEALFARFAKNKTYYCPTHLTRKMEAYADNKTYRNDPRLKYISPLFRAQWQKDADGEIRYDSSPAGRKAAMDFYRKGLALTGKAHKAGVPILAGTDASDSYCFPGFGLHDELEELVKAGLSPLDALRAATVTPAAFFGLQKTHGKVQRGFAAELVLLDDNPLTKISNTRQIHAVIQHGVYYRKSDIKTMLTYVETQANKADVKLKLLWQAITRE